MTIYEAISSVLIESGWEHIEGVAPNRIGEINDWRHPIICPNPTTIWNAANIQDMAEDRKCGD